LVVQREWAAKNPRVILGRPARTGRPGTPITVEDVLNSRMIAYPFRLLQCYLVTDGGGALILVAAERARDFPQKPVYLLGTGESVETPMVSHMADFTSSRAFRVAGAKAFTEAGITHNDVDHLMIYDAPCSLPGASFAHLPIYGLEDLGFVPRGEAGAFIAERNTAPPANCRSTPMAAAFLHAFRHVRQCTHCRRACARCAAPPRLRSPAPRSRSAMVSAACSPPPARS
jgi:acetyl-CoA acetyltransferase